MPQMPGLLGAPTMPGGNGLASLPGMAGMGRGLPGLPGMPKLLGMPGLPGLSGTMPSLGGLPGMPGLGGAGKAPSLSLSQMAPPLPGSGFKPLTSPMQFGLATIKDNSVVVKDERGRPMPNPPRFPTFEECPFPQAIMDRLKSAGFPSPSEIQSYTWPLAVQGKDVIGVAATGSGKTISFLLPAFKDFIEQGVRPGSPSLLVLAPTRELAIQIQEEADKFGKPEIKSVCCYGGAPKPPQAQALRSGIHAVIGTPGRVNDFIEGQELNVGSVNKLVFDEADRMLDMGFEPQIRKVLENVPRQRHTLFFTATWPASVRRLAGDFLNNPCTVTIGNRDELKGNQDITQVLVTVNSNEKNRKLVETLEQGGVANRRNSEAKGLIFCATKRICDSVAEFLDRKSIPCSAVHGDKNQRDREASLNALKEGKIKLVVATDVAARGLDIKGVTLVVNYDPPSNTEDYVHRIGRTGRAGQKGTAVALISERDTHCLKGILQVMKRTNQSLTPELEELARNAPPPPPSGRALKDHKGGPPPVSIDPNFKSGLVSGDMEQAPEVAEDAEDLTDTSFLKKGKGKGKGKGKEDGDKGKGKGKGDRGRSGSRDRGGGRDRSRSRRRRSPSRRRQRDRSPSRKRQRERSPSTKKQRYQSSDSEDSRKGRKSKKKQRYESSDDER